jgi:hypothetical protein
VVQIAVNFLRRASSAEEVSQMVANHHPPPDRSGLIELEMTSMVMHQHFT